MLLREVSDCKNNVFELKRTLWNDVQEDWPFFTEQDRAALRRRKPQNLTPPGSDTGSTSSGHSPSSTNPASPPQITNGLKRHSFGYMDGSHGAASELTGPAAKKKRISNFKRDSGPGGSPGLLLAEPSHNSAHHAVSTSPGLDIAYDTERFQDDTAPDWGRWGQPSESETRQTSGSLESRSPNLEETPEEAADSPSRPGESPHQTPQMQLAPNRNMDFLV